MSAQLLADLVRDAVVPADTKLRTFQVHMRRLGAEPTSDRRKRGHGAAQKAALDAKRAVFVSRLEFFRNRPDKYVIVATDESYCDEGYCRQQSYHIPGDDSTLRYQSKPKGSRWCFSCAITAEKGMLGRSWWAFSPNRGTASKDYHKAFNKDNYMAHFKTMIDAFESAFPGNKQAVFMMDNASTTLRLLPMYRSSVHGSMICARICKRSE